MDNKSTLSKRWSIVLILFIVFLVVIFVQDLVREIVVFDQETKLIKEELNRDIENEALTNTQIITDDFHSKIDNLIDELIHHSEENIESLYFATSAYVTLNPTLSDAELIDEISSITATYNALDEEHHYHIFDTNGNMVYNGETSSDTVVSMINDKDFLNNNYILDFIEGFSSSDTSYASYIEQVEGKAVSYIIYGHKLPGSNLIIANIVNLQGFSEEVKEHALEEFEEQFRSESKEVFIINMNGTFLYHSNKEYIGVNIDNTENQNTVNFLNQVTSFCEEETSGYLDTMFYDETDKLKESLTYVEYLEEWELVVGSNVPTDKYDHIIDTYTRANYQLVLKVKVPSYIVIVLISVLIYVYLKTTINKSQLTVVEEEKLYRKFANLTSEIILITDQQGEIIFANNLGLKTIFGQRSISTKVSFDQIFVEEEGYYILYGYTEDFFVKFVTETIEYKQNPADLYIITDVTEKIKTERKLEALSLIDELTKLGNRRMMVREYNDVILPYVKSGKSAFLVMLDLDDFKPANDIYGHSYGDQVLNEIASIFQKNKDENLYIYRLGGDEFALFFLGQSKEDIISKLTTMQRQVENYDYQKDINVSFSAGITEMKITDKTRRFSDYYDKADKLLYKAKKQGKGKIFS